MSNVPEMRSGPRWLWVLGVVNVAASTLAFLPSSHYPIIGSMCNAACAGGVLGFMLRDWRARIDEWADALRRDRDAL